MPSSFQMPLTGLGVYGLTATIRFGLPGFTSTNEEAELRNIESSRQPTQGKPVERVRGTPRFRVNLLTHRKMRERLWASRARWAIPASLGRSHRFSYIGLTPLS